VIEKIAGFFIPTVHGASVAPYHANACATSGFPHPASSTRERGAGVRFAICTVTFVFLTCTVFAAELSPPGVPTQNLLEHELEVNTRKINTRVVRVTLPPGFNSPLYIHEVPGPRYVLKGQVKVDEGAEAHIYGPTGVFWESGRWMRIANVGTEEAELLAIELTPVSEATIARPR
jgi:quercetin dioxygenase-like cupin family protein